MKETRPYAAAVDEDTASSLSVPSVVDSELFEVTLSGELTLHGASGPNVLRLLDEHPILARMLGMALGRLHVRRPTIHVTATAWVQMRRGLTLCAQEATEGAITVTHEQGWTLSFNALGEAPRTARRVTARMPTARRPRPNAGEPPVVDPEAL